MTLDNLERQNRGFMDFWRFQAATQVYIIHKVEPRNYHYVHFGMKKKNKFIWLKQKYNYSW